MGGSESLAAVLSPEIVTSKECRGAGSYKVRRLEDASPFAIPC